MAFSPDGRYAATGAFDKAVRLWDVESGKELQRFEGHTWGVQAVAYSADGRILSGGCDPDRTVRLWKPLPPAKDRPRKND